MTYNASEPLLRQEMKKFLQHYTANSKNSLIKIRLRNAMRWSRFVCVSKGISHGQCPINRGPRDEELFLFTRVQTASSPPTLLSNKRSSPRVKQSGREADHSPPSRTEVQREANGAVHPHPQTFSWRTTLTLKQLT